MNSLCTDIGYVCLNKCGEQLCGDRVEIVEQGDNATVVVLADGLGSGVKANILSTLTAKIISTMMANDMTIEDCVSTIAATLPVCDVRKVAYSTFTIIRIAGSNLEAELIQYDNPHIIFLRDGKHVDYPEIYEMIDGKAIYKTKLKLREGDAFIAMSEEPGDDTSACTVKIRRREPMNLIIGPPADPKDVNKMMALFFSKEGKPIVCGGTTSTLAAEFLHEPLDVSMPTYIDPEIPPTAKIKGVDLVTEGVITISRVLEYARDYLKDNERYTDWSYKKDGASSIARMLFEEATDINFYVGRAVNPAHQNPNLPIGFNIKMRLIEELSECLKNMGKKIKVSYF